MERSYFLTMMLLVLHQIDAAYWHEWEMFYLPGGIQAYLAFNVVALALVFRGYKHVLQNGDRARFSARLCAGLGMLTFLIHAGFFIAGYAQFHLPLSIALIASCLISSLWQFAELRKWAPPLPA